MFDYTQLDPEQCEFIAVTAVDEIGNGERLFVSIDDQAIVIFNIAGQFFAIGDVCSHDDGPLGDGDLDAFEVICPRHGARFDVRNGKATALPAVVNIPAYPTRLVDGQVEIGLPLHP